MTDKTKQLRMEAVLYLPMEEYETQEEAEDRLIDLCESVGIVLLGFRQTEVIEHAEGGIR